MGRGTQTLVALSGTIEIFEPILIIEIGSLIGWLLVGRHS